MTKKPRNINVEERKIIGEVNKILSKYDAFQEPFDDYSISDELRNLKINIDEIDKESKLVFLAESMAFQFTENYPEQSNVWGTYYGPMAVFKNEEGDWVESPSIRLITPEILNYWIKRSNEAKHPILKIRYADLVWDIYKKITKNNPPVLMAQLVIDETLLLIQKKLYTKEINIITKIKRACSIALSINDKPRLLKIIEQIISLEDKVAEDRYPGLWGFSFDTLINNKKVELEPNQEEKLILDLENRFLRLVKTDAAHPFEAEAAALRLAKYYRSKDQQKKAHKIIQQLGNFYIKASESATPLAAHSWMHKMYEIYISYGMQNEANKISHQLKDIGKKVVDNMKTVSSKISIPIEKIKKYTEEIIQGTLTDSLTRIAWELLPDLENIKSQLKDISKKAPLLSLVEQSVFDREGRVTSKVGSVEDDLDGRILQQYSQNLYFDSIFLNECLIELKKKFNPSVDELLTCLYESPVYSIEFKDIVSLGLDRYLNADFISAAHLLIPQIENSLRKLLTMNKGVIYKQSRTGGLLLRNLDEILRDEMVKLTLSENIITYLKVVLTDQRGWNLRNEVCHGIAHPLVFTGIMCDRILHILLLLAQIKPKSSK